MSLGSPTPVPTKVATSEVPSEPELLPVMTNPNPANASLMALPPSGATLGLAGMGGSGSNPGFGIHTVPTGPGGPTLSWDASNVYNTVTVNYVQLFAAVDRQGISQAEQGVMMEAERRHEQAVNQLCSNANLKLAEAEAVANARHNQALGNLEHKAQERASLLRAELDQFKEALGRSREEAKNADYKLAHLRTTLNEEYTQNRDSMINFLKEEFRKSQDFLKGEMNSKMQLMESDLQSQNDELQDELSAAERALRIHQKTSETNERPPEGGAAASGQDGIVSGEAPPKAPQGPELPNPFVIPKSMRGMFPHLGASIPTVERATAASPPQESGFLTPVEKLPKEPISKEAPPPQSLPQLSEIDKLNLLRASLLGKQPEEDKPKVKEAETIKLPEFPNPETYRSWKTAAREAIRAASDQPDAAFTWVLEAYKKDASHEKLRDPGKFLTLDTKLLASLSKVAKGELARQILNFKEVEAGFERAVRGRQILYLFDQHFKTNEEVGSLYSVEDLLKVTLVQDDLSTFLHNWESVIAGMSHIPDEVTLRDILLRQIRKSQRLKFDLERYDRAKEGTPEHSYEFLKESIRDLLTRERMRKNRDRIAKSHGDKYGAPGFKATKERSGRSPGGESRRRGRSASTSRSSRSRTPSRSSIRQPSQEKQVCRDFLKGKCKRGDECKFLHRPRSKSPNPPKKKIQATCNFWKLGKCQKGDKCRFLHKDLSKPPNKGDEGKPSTPATPAAGDKPDKPRSPTPNGRRRKGSRGRSPNKSDKPAACCVHAAAAPASVSHEEDSWEVDFKSGTLIRHHRNYRTSMFVPTEDDCPMTLSRLGSLVRVEKTLPVHPYTSVCEWSWRDNSDQGHDKTPWVGKSVYRIIPDVAALAAGKPVPSARKSRKVSFQNNPKVYKIRASGLCRKLTLKPRGYAVCYADQENCPKPDRCDLRYAIESARVLEGVIESIKAGVESKCKYECEEDDGPTCQYCENTLKMSCISTNGLEFLADTGSEEDLISRHDHATYYSGVPITEASKQVNLITANGPVQGNKSVNIPIPEFGGDLEFYLLENTPPVCSVGRRCMDEGFDFHWPRGQAPYFITPNGQKLRCRMRGRVPVIGDLDSWASAASESETKKGEPEDRAATQPVLTSGFH